jgi:hypothetical protein
MSHRFPPLRSQGAKTVKVLSGSRALPTPVDLTLVAALVLVVALALI